MTVDDLKEMFDVTDDQDLCPIFGRGKAAISVWRKSGVPASIERVAVRKYRQKLAEEESESASEYPSYWAVHEPTIRRIRPVRTHVDHSEAPGMRTDLYISRLPQQLSNLQLEWIETGLKMGDLEMLEWLVKIKREKQPPKS